jgi:hypothetical protein
MILINQIPILQELNSLSTALIELGKSEGEKIITIDSNNTYKCFKKGILSNYFNGKENSIVKNLTQKTNELMQLYYGIDDSSSKENNPDRKIADQKAMLQAFKILNRNDVVTQIENAKKQEEIYTSDFLTKNTNTVTHEAPNYINSSTNKDNNPDTSSKAPEIKLPKTFEEAEQKLKELQISPPDSKTTPPSLNSNEFKIPQEILHLLPPISQPSNNENDFFYKEPQKPYTNPFKNLPNSILNSNGKIIKWIK